MPAVRSWKPAEKVVKRAVLHHEDHDVLYTARALRVGSRRRLGGRLEWCVQARHCQTCGRPEHLEEGTPGEHVASVAYGPARGNDLRTAGIGPQITRYEGDVSLFSPN